MSYTFYYDPTLTKMVIDKIKEGNRSEVYKLADKIVVLNDKYTKGIDLAFEASERTGSGFPVIWAVNISQTGKEPMPDKNLLFFVNSPTPILNKLLELKLKKHVDTPRSVLIKMARKRINDIRNNVKIQNKWIEERVNQEYYKLVEIGDLDSVEAVDKICKDYRNSRIGQFKFNPDCVREWEEFKKKALFDDDIVKEAWKFILVGDIHEL